MFKELLKSPNTLDPGTIQKEAIENFAEIISKSNFKLGTPNLKENCILLCVATYSVADMDLLDEVNDNFEKWKDIHNIYVMNIADPNFNIDFLDYKKELTFWATASAHAIYSEKTSLPKLFVRGLNQIRALLKLGGIL